jgi:hypothetical protein
MFDIIIEIIIIDRALIILRIINILSRNNCRNLMQKPVLTYAGYFFEIAKTLYTFRAVAMV